MSATIQHYPFPTAVHTYFALADRKVQKRRFLKGEIENPVFIYRSTKNEQDISAYQKTAAHDQPIALKLEVVKTSLALRQDPTYLREFRRANEQLYGTPNREYALAILRHYRVLAEKTDTRNLWEEIQQRIGLDLEPRVFDLGPSPEDFTYYRRQLLRYTSLAPTALSCPEAILFQLDAVGLREKGWRLRLLKASEHARTYHGAKTISVGEKYLPRSESAAGRIAMHEVVGHALRGPHLSLDEAEGFAIFLEQLTGRHFKLRRSYRYLAITLGWGAVAKPMTFREVYEVLWRLMVIGGKSEANAKSHAYDECCRAFRGGRPELAGAVFLKDAVYFDANMRVWEVLSAERLDYNEFVNVIEGRKTLLS